MTGRFFFIKVFSVFLLLSCAPKEERVGRVVKVIDGDTIDVLMESSSQKFRIRLFGVDAPERGQGYNVKSKEYTASLVANKQVRLVVDKKDQYGRFVADVYLIDGTHVNAQLVKAGYAWHNKAYSDSKKLAQLEATARKEKLGLWQDPHPQAPWEFRKQKRKQN